MASATASTAPTISSRRQIRFATAPRRADAAAVALLLALTVVATWPLLGGGVMIGQDTAAFFYPMFSFLGRELRAGHLPAWNPYQLGGAPFAADPESGWMYLPAMLLFGALGLTAAAKTFLFCHLALAGLGTYALGRRLGLSVPGGLVAAVAYEYTGLIYGRAVCCPVYLQVAAWAPVVLLGAELAVRARGQTARVGWWGLTGFALSQVFASWIGQGSYYVLLALGGFVAYRTLVDPATRTARWRDRAGNLVLHGAAPLVLGFALAAAGALPRLEFRARSNLAHGYGGDLSWAATLGGWPVVGMAEHLLGRTLYYAGGATIALAVVGLLAARGRYAAPYFALLTAGALVLAARHPTPLHRLLYAILPQFEELHRHWPERIMVVFYLGPALLAGAAVSALPRWRLRPTGLAFLALAPVAGLASITNAGAAIPRSTEVAVIGASVAVAVYALVPLIAVRRLIPLLLVAAVFLDLRAADRDIVAHGLYGGFYKVDLDAYYDPAGAAAFLRARESGQPFRYFGYDPAIFSPDVGGAALYRNQFVESRTTALIVNNRATLFGLQDVQGYNPLQLQRFVEYMDALNGHGQEYHGSYVLAEGLNSPLLDLLNARYVVVPASVPVDRLDLLQLVRDNPVVYRDERVQILERRDALPRAWIVHEARQLAPSQALGLLASRAVDPRRTALLEEAPPALGPAPGSAAPPDQATVVTDGANEVRVQTTTAAPGMLVLSEVYYPAWKAYVDGKPVRLYVADHALRAVPVPAGAHTVELRYESRTLRLGLAISAVSFGALAVVWLVAGWQWWRSRRRGDETGTPAATMIVRVEAP